MMKRKPLTWALEIQWSQAAHANFLDALMACADWGGKQFAFHGGTSLHLSWNSARYSEDLDFLLSREVKDVDRVLAKTLVKVREQFRAIDPLFAVDFKDKSADPSRMVNYNLTVSHPGYVGNAMVKVEFWRTSDTYLQQYPTEFRTPSPQGGVIARVMNPVPAASLETAYADKLTAFATRPYLKWRDLYDLWWIGTQSQSRLDVETVAAQFLHNVQAYDTIDGLAPAAALRKFLENDRQVIASRSDPELKRWLPDGLWNTLHPEGVRQMVEYVFYALDAIANAIDPQIDRPGDEVDLKRIPAPK